MTRKTIRRAAWIVGTVSVTRWTYGSRPGGPSVARRSATSSCGEPGKSDAMCPSGPRPSSSRSSVDAVEGGVELRRRLGRRQLAADPVDAPRLHLEAVEERLLREAEVRALVVGGTQPLVAPPERHRAPVGRELGRAAVGLPGVEPPVRTIDPPARAARRGALRLRAAGSSTTFSSGCKGQGYETPCVPRQEVHAREAGPLAVGREQLVGLVGLDPAPPQRGGELREAQVAVEAVLVAAEALEADDAERPGAEPALAGEPGDDRGASGGASSSRGRSVRQSRTSAPPRRAPRPSLPSSAGENACQLGGGRRGVQPAELGRRCAHDRPLDLPRPARLDQLAGDGAQQRLRDRAGAHRAEAAEPADGLAEQRVAREPLQELGVVVVEPEREPDVVDALAALAATTIVPSGRCSACTRSSRSSTRIVAR